ncbi:MAG: LamG domain-containing protein, partial [Leeuwenhoekiella sp.]
MKKKLPNHLKLYCAIFLTILFQANYAQPVEKAVDNIFTTLWQNLNNDGFNAQVSGIGRYDLLTLNRKQSKTADFNNFLKIGLADTIISNATVQSSFSHNKDFLIWANNNAPISSEKNLQIDLSSGITAVNLTTELKCIPIGRIWKVAEFYEKGNGIPSVKISIPMNALSEVSTTGGKYLMLISDNAQFDETTPFVILTNNNGNLETVYNFENTKYITFAYAPEKKLARSVKFDGIDDFMDAGNSLNLAQSFSISAWIKRTGNGVLISKNNTEQTEGYQLSIRSDMHAEFSFFNQIKNSVISSIAIPEEEWHHIAVTYDGTQMKMYIDGVLDTQKTVKNLPVPTSNPFLIGASGGNNPSLFYNGNIDEIRIWNISLNIDQLRFLMNQELPFLKNDPNNAIIPQNQSKTGFSIPYSNLVAYYPMKTYAYSTTMDESGNENTLTLKNINTVDLQTAPLPYISKADGDWNKKETWVNGSYQTLPNAKSLVDPDLIIDWNIVKTKHNVNVSLNTKVLGLIIESNELSLVNDNKIEVTRYLKLNGILNLEGDAQLIQTENSLLDKSSIGSLINPHKGSADLYSYNYWSSPVSPENRRENNRDYSIKYILKDGNSGRLKNLNFTGGYDGSAGNPVTISAYWLYTFRNLPDGKSDWKYVGENGKIDVGLGFTMKGP